MVQAARPATGPGHAGREPHDGGLDVSGARVGERWRVGTVLLEVREPRLPCFKLGLRLGDRRFPPRFADACRPGAYLAVLQEGVLAAGDAVHREDVPDHDVTVGLMMRAYLHDRALAPRLLEAPRLTAQWRVWAASRTG